MSTEETFARYSRQIRFAPLGEEGQRKLASARVAVCGCGALGTVIANGLVRAGVGFVRIIDRDFLELNNLQRQILFDEQDLAEALPKAEAAAGKLRRINSAVEVEAVVTDLDYANIDALCRDVHLLMDGTDNFETRFLINDYCVSRGKPWVFGGCIGSQGQCMTIVPGVTPCYRCLVEEAPPPGTTATCESAGILASASGMVGSLQVAEGIKILSGNESALRRGFVVFDLWDNSFRELRLDGLREKVDCPVCKQCRFDWLEGKEGGHTTILCGRNAVQVVPSRRGNLDLEQLRQRIATAADSVTSNRFLLRFEIEEYQFSVFPDGRAIIKGTDDIGQAKSLYARYVGS
ncbi:MAG: ThiF family adenylyltransferase [Planctomycetota bacterium]